MNRDGTKIEPVPSIWLTAPAVTFVLFFLAEFIYSKHPHVQYEEWFGFYSFAGLTTAVVLALLSLLLRPLLWRGKEFYDG